MQSTQIPLAILNDQPAGKAHVVGLFFGGRSAEHDVSVRSAATLYAALRDAGYRVVPIGVQRSGAWRHMPLTGASFHRHVDPHGLAVTLAPAGGGQLIAGDGSHPAGDLPRIDVAFPALHGPFGEDGCIQGLFETCDVRYVGAGVLAGAVTIDKEVTKRLLMQAGMPVVPYRLHRRGKPLPTWQAMSDSLGPRLYVKPASLGSSIGTAPADDATSFERALGDAIEHGHKVLIERRVVGRELECGVMETDNGPLTSVVGEIDVGTQHAFYDYAAKYAYGSQANVEVPARLAPEIAQRVRAMAAKAFEVLGCNGLARVDFFLGEQGELFINEVNTLPGFTSISLFPRMFEASGIPIKEQVTQLVNLALARA